ncbi:MAG TPA: NifB/NifX family molybdenum-iron cluster-binding protein [Jiangellaceae bacterium]
MIVCIPVTADGQTGPHWGRASRVALANVSDGRIIEWREVEVGWDAAHGTGTEGSHHARIARFLREHEVEVVVANHMGEGMARMLTTMGIPTMIGTRADAREAVLGAVSALDDSR